MRSPDTGDAAGHFVTQADTPVGCETSSLATELAYGVKAQPQPPIYRLSTSGLSSPLV